MQVTLQAAIKVVGAKTEADLQTEPHTRRSSPEESYKARWAEPMLTQAAFDWKTPDRYVELLHFEMEVENVQCESI